MRCSLCVASLATLFTTCLATSVIADPIVGRDVLKFTQAPMINTPIPVQPGVVELFHGHDEISTAWGDPSASGPLVYSGTFMADDFADHFNSPVVHVKWWGSYLNRPTNIPEPFVRRFLITFENDVPVSDANAFSHPGENSFNQIVSLDADGMLTKGEGTFTEKVIPGVESVDGPIFVYNAELHLDKAFLQKPDTVYWLKIVALVDSPLDIPVNERLQWGWHNRDYTKMDPLASTPLAVTPGEHTDGSIGDVPIWHFQDDAVSGLVDVQIDPAMPFMPNIRQFEFQPENYQSPSDGPSLIATHSKDLAFELYTVPEPVALALAFVAMIGGVFAGGRHRK